MDVAHRNGRLIALLIVAPIGRGADGQHLPGPAAPPARGRAKNSSTTTFWPLNCARLYVLPSAAGSALMAGAGVPTASRPWVLGELLEELPWLAMRAKTMMPMTSTPVPMASQVPPERCLSRWPKVGFRRRWRRRCGLVDAGSDDLGNDRWAIFRLRYLVAL